MDYQYEFPIDYSAAIASAFDVGGNLLMHHIIRQSNGIQYDVDKLLKDQKILANDYRNACKSIAENQENQK